MKTDMLLDPETRDGIHYTHRQHNAPPATSGSSKHKQHEPRDQPKAKKAHSSAAWIMENHDHVAEMTNPNTVFKEPDQPLIETQHSVPSSSKSGANGGQPNGPSSRSHTTKLKPAESPLAPLATQTNASRQDLSNSHEDVVSPPPIFQSPRISEPDYSTQYTTSSDQTNTGSTAPSSEAFTPSTDSNRVSDNVYSQTTSVEDGEWMKQGVEKHRQAQKQASPYRTTSPTVTISPADASSKGADVQSLDRPVSQNRIGINNTLGTGTTDSNFNEAKSKSQPLPREPPAGFTIPPREHARPPRLNTHPTFSNRSSSLPSSRRSSRPGSSRRLSQDGIKETPRSPMPDFDDTDIPPVPQLDPRRKSELGNGNPSPRPGHAASLGHAHHESDQAAKMLEQRLSSIRDGFEEPLRDNTSRPSSTVTILGAGGSPDDARAEPSAISPGKQPIRQQPEHLPDLTHGSSWPVSDTPATSSDAVHPIQSTFQSSNDPAKHQQDASILVKDFYRPYSRPTWPDGPTSRDPKPADFDSLMSIMNQHRELPRPYSPIPQQPDEEASPVIDGKALPQLSTSQSTHANNTPQLTDDTTPSLTKERSPSLAASNGLSQHPVNNTQPASSDIVSVVSSDHLPKSPPPMSQKASSQHSKAPSTHTRTSQGTTKSKKESRGLNKLLWKLAGGEMPVRKKIYIPEPDPKPRTPQSQNNAVGARDGEEGYDEEACAAPVVGFGRGW